MAYGKIFEQLMRGSGGRVKRPVGDEIRAFRAKKSVSKTRKGLAGDTPEPDYYALGSASEHIPGPSMTQSIYGTRRGFPGNPRALGPKKNRQRRKS